MADPTRPGSKFFDPDPSLIGVETFAQDWGKLVFCMYAQPVSQLIRCAMRIRECQCKGVIILPLWRASQFIYFFMDKNDNTQKPFVLVKMWKPYLIQNEGAKNTALFGEVGFEFLALFFNTC